MTTDRQVVTLEPLDTLFLREARAFDAGEASESYSLFPPLPFTTRGLLCSKILIRHCGPRPAFRHGCRGCEHDGQCTAQTSVGRYGRDGTLHVRGPWLAIDGVAALPAPLDLIAATDSMDNCRAGHSGCVQTALLAPKIGALPQSNLPGGLHALAPPQALTRAGFEAVGGWIAWPRYLEYLAGQPPALQRGSDWWEGDDVVAEELRPGLEMDPETNTSRDGMLYFARHRRTAANVRLVVAAEGFAGGENAVSTAPIAPMGGERRAVALTIADGSLEPWHGAVPATVRDAVKASGRLKLVLLQPACLEKGWQPHHWTLGDAGQDARATLPMPDGTTLTATWRAARFERPLVVGGWDMRQRDQKPARRMLPSGSVFYLEAPPDEACALLDACWNTCLPAHPDDTVAPAAAGFGQVLVGAWDPANETT